jgi:hypothetical protein
MRRAFQWHRVRWSARLRGGLRIHRPELTRAPNDIPPLSNCGVSKPITSAAIFGLIEKGRLRSEDRVFGRYGILGTKYGSPPYGHGVEQITIDQLLTHTSGGWSNLTNDPMVLNIGLDQAELISWALDNQPLSNPPGKVFAYSNFGYCILGRVIEKVTGQPSYRTGAGSVNYQSGIRHGCPSGLEPLALHFEQWVLRDHVSPAAVTFQCGGVHFDPAQGKPIGESFASRSLSVDFTAQSFAPAFRDGHRIPDVEHP